jgi:type IV secretory pathway VirB2 component (pilin)
VNSVKIRLNIGNVHQVVTFLCYNGSIWAFSQDSLTFIRKGFFMTYLQVKSAQGMIDACWQLTALFAVCICIAMLPDTASAVGGTNAIEKVFCNAVQMLTGGTGKAIATIAIIAVGIGALLGKISWGMALIVACGVALVFGAAGIVTALGGDSGNCASGTLS